MIKKLLAIVVVIGTLGAGACGAKDTSADEAKLKTDSGVWFDKYNAGDADAVANLYADDAVVLPDKAPALVGKAAFHTYIAADIAKSKAAGLTFQNGAVTGVGVSGDFAWLSGTFAVADPTGMAVDSGKYLSVYHRTDKGWFLIRDTWNSDKVPAPPPPPAPAKKSLIKRIIHK